MLPVWCHQRNWWHHWQHHHSVEWGIFNVYYTSTHKKCDDVKLVSFVLIWFSSDAAKSQLDSYYTSKPRKEGEKIPKNINFLLLIYWSLVNKLGRVHNGVVFSHWRKKEDLALQVFLMTLLFVDSIIQKSLTLPLNPVLQVPQHSSKWKHFYHNRWLPW